jgi:hypothetical protein
LREVCKYTLEKSRSFENLKGALEKIKVINNIINIRKKEADNRKKIMEIRENLRYKKDNQIDLLAPGRLFVREGILFTFASSFRSNYTSPSSN